MRKEFLVKQERRLAETYLSVVKDKESCMKSITEICADIAGEVIDSVMPILEETAPYIAAALRFLADFIESELDVVDQGLSREAKDLMASSLKLRKQNERY